MSSSYCEVKSSNWSIRVHWTLDWSGERAYAYYEVISNPYNRLFMIKNIGTGSRVDFYTSPIWLPFGKYRIQGFSGGSWKEDANDYIYFPPMYTVSFDNGGMGTAPAATQVQQGSGITLQSMGEVSGETYTVTYNSNGTDAASPAPVSSQGKYKHTAWASGSPSGTKYAPGALYGPGGSITLYGIWTFENNVTLAPALTRNDTVNYTISFDSNGGLEKPPDLIGTYTYQQLSWNTSPDGTGTSYAPGSTQNISKNVTLYAIWTKVSEKVTLPAAISRNSDELKFTIGYRLNGGDSQQPADQMLIRTTPYTFGGWNTNSGGTGTNYAAGASYSPTDDVTTLYAKWTTGKTVGSIIIADAPTKENTYEDGFTATLDLRGGKCEVSSVTAKDLVQWKFLKWNTTADGTGTSYYPGDVYTTHADIRLHAQWGKYATIIPTQLPIPKRSGYAFVGWGFTPLDEEGVMEIELFDDIILYAIWVESYSGAHYNNNGIDTPCLVYYNNNGVAVLCDVYYNRRGRPMKT